MSEDNQIVAVPHADFTMKDLEIIEKFKEDGLLGLHTLVDTDVERCMALYLDGKTYRQIANITKIKKDVVLYLANKFAWWELRRNYLDELQAIMKDKILESKLQNQEFLFDLIMAYRKKIGKNLNRYLKTDDEQWMDKFDTKDMNVLFKCMELLEKLDTDSFKDPANERALVGLNPGETGVTITKTGANSVEVTPKSPFSSKLKQFADLKREQEKASQAPPRPSHDITPVTPNEKERDEDENE